MQSNTFQFPCWLVKNNGFCADENIVEIGPAMYSGWRRKKTVKMVIDNDTHWNVFDCNSNNKRAKVTREFNTIRPLSLYISIYLWFLRQTAVTNQMKKVSCLQRSHSPFVFSTCIFDFFFCVLLVSKSTTHYIVCLAVSFSAAILIVHVFHANCFYLYLSNFATFYCI